MSQSTETLRVLVTPDGFYPRSWWWEGRAVRALFLEEVRTRGLERRFRVHTGEGRYELSYHCGTGAWQMLRAPSWFARARMRLQRMPRYPLPAARRRRRFAESQRLKDAAPLRAVQLSLSPAAGQ